MPTILRGGMAINAVLVDPNGANNFDADGGGGANATDEYIEHVNLSGSTIDVSELELWDAANDNGIQGRFKAS